VCVCVFVCVCYDGASVFNCIDISQQIETWLRTGFPSSPSLVAIVFPPDAVAVAVATAHKSFNHQWHIDNAIGRWLPLGRMSYDMQFLLFLNPPYPTPQPIAVTSIFLLPTLFLYFSHFLEACAP